MNKVCLELGRDYKWKNWTSYMKFSDYFNNTS